MRYKTLSYPEKYIIKGIPWLFIIGTIMHFMYDLFGKNPIIALFAPANESIWEHSKMVLIPIILWWTIYYIIKKKSYNINKNIWYTSSLISLLTALLTIPILYYFYTGALGFHLLWIDIFILFIAISFGQLLALHFYNHSRGINFINVWIIFAILILLFMLFTLYPPSLPIFTTS